MAGDEGSDSEVAVVLPPKAQPPVMSKYQQKKARKRVCCMFACVNLIVVH